MQELGQERACQSKKTSGNLEELRYEQFVKKKRWKILDLVQEILLLEYQKAPKDQSQQERDKFGYALYQSLIFHFSNQYQKEKPRVCVCKFA